MSECKKVSENEDSVGLAVLLGRLWQESTLPLVISTSEHIEFQVVLEHRNNSGLVTQLQLQITCALSGCEFMQRRCVQ